ncbi:RDD family protein [Pseudomonas asplenii]|uniref:RDD family protein n=1 Tax=Pseudomonas asplenii TaxID=53407 RepID=UPI00037DFDAB|nr:RDD family protein [Pseudomonas fuscovaginae]
MSTTESISSVSLYDLASPWKRLFAYVIDLLVIFLLVVLEHFLDFLPFPGRSGIGIALNLLENTLLFLALGYFLLGDALPNGQTLGKRLMGISVVGFPVNTRCTVFQSFLRNVPKVLFSVLDALFVLFGLRRRLGDMLAMTMVVNK